MEKSAVLDGAMDTLYSEVHSAESTLWNALDTAKSKLSELIKNTVEDYEKKVSTLSDQVKFLSGQVEIHKKESAVLESRITSLTEELEKSKIQDNNYVEKMKVQGSELAHKEGEISLLKDKIREINKERTLEKNSCHIKYKEQSDMLKEYQEKVALTTSKMLKLSQQMKNEKSASERMKISHSSEVNRQTAEVKKLSLEVSKLKTQLSSSNKTLFVSKEEIKSLTEQLRLSQEAESTEAKLHQQHCMTVQVLKEKISTLEDEIRELKATHASELERVREEYCGIHFMDARIAFLQHQNRKEKVKLDKDNL